MDAYFSYWGAGYKNKPNEVVLYLQKISNYFANKHFDNVYLITDSDSVNYFKNLPWTNISTELDSLDKKLGGVWSLGKILAYKIASEKNKPFIHIDYDVFLYNGLPEKLIGAEVFAQSDEWYAKTAYQIDLFLKDCPNTFFIPIFQQNSAANLGIFGGTNTAFINRYANEALNLATCKENYKFWTEYGKFDNYWAKATIVEQYFLVSLSILMSQKITFLFDTDQEISYRGQEYGYTHFMGQKDNPHMKTYLENYIREHNIP
jgi:hypothetical protein